jgi:hypothetical protein
VSAYLGANLIIIFRFWTLFLRQIWDFDNGRKVQPIALVFYTFTNNSDNPPQKEFLYLYNELHTTQNNTPTKLFNIFSIHEETIYVSVVGHCADNHVGGWLASQLQWRDASGVLLGQLWHHMECA